MIRSLMVLEGEDVNAELDARVARGAALLDKARPGWAAKISLDTLAMESCDRCILGQLCGEFKRGFKSIIADEPNIVLFRSGEYGFTLIEDEQWIEVHAVRSTTAAAMARFEMLGDAWRRAIRSRIGGGN